MTDRRHPAPAVLRSAHAEPLDPRRRALSLAALGCLAILGGPARAEAPLQVLLPDDVLRDYQLYLGDRDPRRIEDFAGPYVRRDVVELLLLQQALAVQGPERLIKLHAMPTSARLHLELDRGRGVCSGTSYWRQDFPETTPHLLFSAPVVRDGEFEVGLYTMPGNRAAMGARSLADLRRLTVLSNRDWRVDWQTLQQLGIENLMHVGSWNLMPRMVASGRADVLLAPFQATPDMSLQVDDVRLVPIRGLKLAMHGSRHFLISAQHAQGEALKEQLDAGLQRLRQQGVIQRAYRQSGFFSERTAGWLTL